MRLRQTTDGDDGSAPSAPSPTTACSTLKTMLAIQTNQLAWLASMAAHARERLKDPMANASEPLRIESEVAQERQNIDTAQGQRIRLARQLNILLGRDTDEAWPHLRLPASASLTPALAAELARLYQVNPTLQALLNTAEAAKSDIKVARRERSPISSVGVESSFYSGGDFRQATVGARMTLPWFNKSVYRANTDRKRDRFKASSSQFGKRGVPLSPLSSVRRRRGSHEQGVMSGVACSAHPFLTSLPARGGRGGAGRGGQP